MTLTIKTWSPTHPRWAELVTLIKQEEQTYWAFAPMFDPFPSPIRKICRIRENPYSIFGARKSITKMNTQSKQA